MASTAGRQMRQCEAISPLTASFPKDGFSASGGIAMRTEFWVVVFFAWKMHPRSNVLLSPAPVFPPARKAIA